MSVWCEDEAGPYQTIPYPGHRWCRLGQHQPHEYFRDGTAKLLTLFHPVTGQVRVKGVTSSPNVVLHSWLKTELTAILAALPPPEPHTAEARRCIWHEWGRIGGLGMEYGRNLVPLRLLLVMDNLAGHKSGDWVSWCYQRGIMILYTPLGGSWLNMAESIQRLLKRRALDGEHFLSVPPMIQALEAVADHWNQHATPFIWGGKRRERRRRALCTHRLGGSGAVTARSVRAFYARLRPK